MFISLKNSYFSSVVFFLQKCLEETMGENYQDETHFKLEKNDDIFHIIHQIKFLMVSYWIGHPRPLLLNWGSHDIITTASLYFSYQPAVNSSEDGV